MWAPVRVAERVVTLAKLPHQYITGRRHHNTRSSGRPRLLVRVQHKTNEFQGELVWRIDALRGRLITAESAIYYGGHQLRRQLYFRVSNSTRVEHDTTPDTLII